MSRHSLVRGLAGMAVAGLLGFLAAGYFSSKIRHPGREAAPVAVPASEAPASARSARMARQRPALSATTPEAREQALQQRLAMAKQIVSVPPAGRAQREPGSVPAGALPAPPPELAARRQAALVGWQQAAQRLMDTCVARPEGTRQAVALEVAFAPIPGAPGERRQVLVPEWIMVPPHELERLWQDTDPERLQDCLERARSLTVTVPLPDDALAHGVPMAAESLRIQL
jgi:hypothetical protein